MTPQGQTGYPDRMFLIPGGRPLLIEFKLPGEEPRAKQGHIHGVLKELGYNVQVHDDYDEAMKAIEEAVYESRR